MLFKNIRASIPPEFFRLPKAVIKKESTSLLKIPLFYPDAEVIPPVVSKGQRVIAGELIARKDSFLTPAIYAPVTGIIRGIEYLPSYTYAQVPFIVIEKEAENTTVKKFETPINISSDPSLIYQWLLDCGLMAHGRVAKPYHLLLNDPHKQPISKIVIHHYVHDAYRFLPMFVPEDIVFALIGLQLLARLYPQQEFVFASDDPLIMTMLKHRDLSFIKNKITYMQFRPRLTPHLSASLKKKLLGRKLLAKEKQIVLLFLSEIIDLGKVFSSQQPKTSQQVLVSGDVFQENGFFDVTIGSLIAELFPLNEQHCNDHVHIAVNNPLSGHCLPTFDTSIHQRVWSLYGSRIGEIEQQDCIRCGLCVDCCPVSIMPVYGGSKKCIRCGWCDSVCPSSIPLMQDIVLHHFPSHQIERISI